MDRLAAIIITGPERLSTGIRAAREMLNRGMRVRVLAVTEGRPPSTKDADVEVVDVSDMGGAECFSCQPGCGRRDGFRHATIEAMSGLLKDAEVVIPF